MDVKEYVPNGYANWLEYYRGVARKQAHDKLVENIVGSAFVVGLLLFAYVGVAYLETAL